jgi:exodeoxyribonuclease III
MGSHGGPPRLQIATWNVNSLRVRLPHVLRWLGHGSIDVLGLQETKLTDEMFPVDAVREAGFEPLYTGQSAYNGVALLVRSGLPVSAVVKALPEFDDGQRRVLVATLGDVRVVNLYVPNGEAVGTDKYRYKLDWLDALHGYLQEELRRHPRLLVMGDFNIAPADEDVYDPALWRDRVLFSPPERRALEALLALGLRDVFRCFEQPGGSYSWWDYRAGAFRRNLGLRIDLQLASPQLAAECLECRIDREPRRWERPSDHAPVVAAFERAETVT